MLPLTNVLIGESFGTIFGEAIYLTTSSPADLDESDLLISVSLNFS
jgi:hypothetical protein